MTWETRGGASGRRAHADPVGRGVGHSVPVEDDAGRDEVNAAGGARIPRARRREGYGPPAHSRPSDCHAHQRGRASEQGPRCYDHFRWPSTPRRWGWRGPQPRSLAQHRQSAKENRIRLPERRFPASAHRMAGARWNISGLMMFFVAMFTTSILVPPTQTHLRIATTHTLYHPRLCSILIRIDAQQ